MSARQFDHTRLSAALLTAAPLLLAGSCAQAHGTAMNSADTAATQRATEIATPPRTDIKSFEGAKLSLTQAISDAEQKDGGKAILASVHARSQGNVAYKLDLVKNNRLHVAMVDAQTGQLR